MTAEIAVMNRNAVVLAADSASTVTSWKDGKQERRYFKGANKLFELCRNAPIGLMIYGSAGIQGVPWELVVKSFRETCTALGSQHDHLSGYSKNFLDYVEDQEKLFSDETKSQHLIESIGSSSWRLLERLMKEFGAEDFEVFDTKSVGEIEFALNKIDVAISELEYGPRIDDADVASAIAKYAEIFVKIKNENFFFFKDRPERQELTRKFVEIQIKLAVKEFCKFDDITGIVIAGYGTDDFYPVLEVYECYGFLDKKLIYRKKDSISRTMDSRADAVIQPFATTSMIDTFRMGIAHDIFEAVIDSTKSSLSEIAHKALDEAGAVGVIGEDRISELVEAATSANTDFWLQEMRNQHYQPLSRVIHSLPLPDMAALAKSLIDLESLKERVTRPSESVSGPIDVAVISKYDGFVWIERKHYFDPELNHRFFKRNH